MSAAGNFYDAQAEICAQSASATQLPMLREKFERAGAAWEALATREKQIEAARKVREAATLATAAAAAMAAALADEAGVDEAGADEDAETESAEL